MQIQWYPGHMARTKRELTQRLAGVQLVIELCDARIPLSSRNPSLIRLAQGKKRLLVLTKTDLAAQDATAQWLRYFRARGEMALAWDASARRSKEALAAIGQAAEEIVRRAKERGVNKTVRAMVVGVPNVGKSTFINRLYGGAVAKAGDRPGVTRASQWVKVSPYLELMDTPGLLWPNLTDQNAARRLAYIGTIRDAVYDTRELTVRLLRDLLRIAPEKTRERFHLSAEWDAERASGAEGTGAAGAPIPASSDASVTSDTPDALNAGFDGAFPDIPTADQLLLDAVCRGRGFLMRGGACDIERCCAVVLDEFRAGKLGRITLEAPPAPVARMAGGGSAPVPPPESEARRDDAE